jgi:hypothetical protein
VVLDATTGRTTTLWQSLIQAAKLQPLIIKLLEYGDPENLPQRKVNITRYSVGASPRYMLGKFEVSELNTSAAVTYLNNRLTFYSLATTGSNAVKFGRLLEHELRLAAISLGFTAPQAANLSATVIGLGAPLTAIAEAQAWIDARFNDWNGSLV